MGQLIDALLLLARVSRCDLSLRKRRELSKTHFVQQNVYGVSLAKAMEEMQIGLRTYQLSLSTLDLDLLESLEGPSAREDQPRHRSDRRRDEPRFPRRDGRDSHRARGSDTPSGYREDMDPAETSIPPSAAADSEDFEGGLSEAPASMSEAPESDVGALAPVIPRHFAVVWLC